MSDASTAYDILRGQILLQQCALDVLLTSHPQREKLAVAFQDQSDAFIKMITEGGFAEEAIKVVQEMQWSMLKRLGRTGH